MSPGIHKKMKRGKAAGFTLIEVLVVVAIIALLVAILIPTLSKARKQARRAVCASNLHQIAIGLLTYREYYKEYPQPAMINVNPSTGKGEIFGLMSESTHRALGRFLKTGYKDSSDDNEVRAGDLFYCPEVKEYDRFGDVEGIDQVDANAEPYVHTTYVYLARMDGMANDPARCHTSWGDPTPCNPRTDIPAARRNYVIKEPDARKVMIGGMMMYWAGGSPGPRWRVNHLATYTPVASVAKVPFEGMNMGYGDGHVEWRNKAKFPDVFGSDIDPRSAAVRQTAGLIRGNDMWWW